VDRRLAAPALERGPAEAGVSLGCVSDTVYLPVHLELDGEPISADVTVTGVGAQAIVVRTASADLELVLYSAYVGHDELDRAQVAEALELGDEPPELISREVPAPSGAFTHARRFALYDHLQRLQELIGLRCSQRLSVSGLAEAARAIDPAAV
jgi:hypothetical protein